MSDWRDDDLNSDDDLDANGTDANDDRPLEVTSSMELLETLDEAEFSLAMAEHFIRTRSHDIPALMRVLKLNQENTVFKALITNVLHARAALN